MENDAVTGGTIGGVHRPSGKGKLENKFSSILEAFPVVVVFCFFYCFVHACMYGAFFFFFFFVCVCVCVCV